jgi:hypothetical protein
MLRGARQTAGEVRADGTQLVSDFHELSDSLRSNADRLLRDIIAIHSNMLDQIDRIDPDDAAPQESPPAVGRTPSRPDDDRAWNEGARARNEDVRPRRGPLGAPAGEYPNDRRRVPEFIPPD